MKVSTLMNQLEDLGVDREVVVQLPGQPGVDMALSRGGRMTVKAAAIEGDRLVILELGPAVEEGS